MTTETLVFDCDPGLDDAVALALAHSSEVFRITAVSTVACNAPIEIVTANASAILACLDNPAPVFAGASRPLVVEPRHAIHLWGGDGILPLTSRSMTSSPIDLQWRAHLEAADTVIAIASLTNIANALAGGARIRRLAIMGGALGKGNATEHAELNIWADPHAAAVVFSSGVKITMAPLDLTRTLRVPANALARLAASTRPAARLCAELLPLAGSKGQPAAIHDAAIVAWLLWPDLFITAQGTISVITEGEEQGRTVFARSASGPHTVLTGAAEPALLERIIARICGEA
ncbi:MAG: nucleoside hydrolase [Parvibaculaceae bacterium]